MKFEKILFCKWTELSHVTEQESLQKGFTISLYDIAFTNKGPAKFAFMIFLGQADNNIDYEVRVYKSNKNDIYKKLPQDNQIRYEENDGFVSFFFYCYYQAHKFTDTILPFHGEFNNRPAKIIPI